MLQGVNTNQFLIFREFLFEIYCNDEDKNLVLAEVIT